MRHDAALSPVAFSGFEVREILGCQRLLVGGRIPECLGYGIRGFLPEVLDEPQRSMDLPLRQVIHEGMQPLFLRHALQLTPTGFSDPRSTPAADVTRSGAESLISAL